MPPPHLCPHAPRGMGHCLTGLTVSGGGVRGTWSRGELAPGEANPSEEGVQGCFLEEEA